MRLRKRAGTGSHGFGFLSVDKKQEGPKEYTGSCKQHLYIFLIEPTIIPILKRLLHGATAKSTSNTL